MTIQGLTIASGSERHTAGLARLHLDTVLFAYADIFGRDAPRPTLEELNADWRAALADPQVQVLVATTDGRGVVGSVRVGPDPDDPGEGRLSRLHVHPDVWDQGVGGLLHDAGVSALAAANWAATSLWVLEENVRARAFYERRGWTLVGGHTLERPGLPREVRYRYQLRLTHPDHDEVAAEVRAWYTRPTPEIGLHVEAHWFGYLAEGPGAVGRRAMLGLDDSGQLARALAEATELSGDRELDLWVDDRERAEILDASLSGSGYRPTQDTVYLALVGPIAAHPGPADLSVVDLDVDDLGTWAEVKLRGFGDTEAAPAPDLVAVEVAQRRAEAPLARYRMGLLEGEPVSALAHYTGTDQLVFSLATRLPFRHRGVAQALLGIWAEDGVRDGCRSLIINADDGGTPASLYRRMGFVDEVYWQRRYTKTSTGD